jgi:hypothetical protein
MMKCAVSFVLLPCLVSLVLGCTGTRVRGNSGGAIGMREEAGAPRSDPNPGALVAAGATDGATDGGARGAKPGMPELAADVLIGAEQTQTIALASGAGVTLRTAGASYIEIALVETDKHVASRKIEIQRRLLSDPALPPQVDSLQRAKSDGPIPFYQQGAPEVYQAEREVSSRHGHAATPGATYVYRARVSGASAWSPEVRVTMPVAAAPPAAPTQLVVTAKGSFAVQVAWESSSRTVAGFEVLQGGKHVALVDPVARAFVHHGRLPGETYAYSVRAFNARGVSASASTVRVTTPPRFEGAATIKSGRPSACIAPVVAPPKCKGGTPDIESLDGKTRTMLSVPSPGDCMRRRIVGTYRGCTRELGVFSFQGPMNVVISADDTASAAYPDGDWPLLSAVAGAGSFVGAQIEMMQFREGHYAIVDTDYVCGEWRAEMSDPTLSPVDCSMEDVTQCAPPFERCRSPE